MGVRKRHSDKEPCEAIAVLENKVQVVERCGEIAVWLFSPMVVIGPVPHFVLPLRGAKPLILACTFTFFETIWSYGLGLIAHQSC